MLIFKKIVSQFFYPLPLSLEISFLGLFLLWFTSKQKTGKVLVSIGFLILTPLSYGPISDQLLASLESRYISYDANDSDENSKFKARFVVVLGGGHTSDPTLPITSQIDGFSLVRLVEGIRIYRKYPSSRLLLSGGGAFQPVPNAEAMASVAKEIGVNANDMITETKSKDTKDEANMIKPMVGSNPFILVTSAWHMPRAMAMFKRQGMNPIPAPTGHLAKKRGLLKPRAFFPNIDDLYKSKWAIHEYLGMAWAKLRGQI
jgi:uncharacterized SAM-binding protein YcdF (DUF218 family)